MIIHSCFSLSMDQLRQCCSWENIPRHQNEILVTVTLDNCLISIIKKQKFFAVQFCICCLEVAILTAFHSWRVFCCHCSYAFILL